MRKKLFFIFFFSLFFSPTFSLAKTPRVAIQVSPLLREYTIFPGGRVKDILVFYNPSSDSQKVQIKVYDFLPADERGGLRFFQDAGWQFSASRWILFEPKNFVLKPKEERTLPISILVPENAEPGTHFAAVFGEALPKEKEEEKGQVRVKVHVGAGTLFLINVPDVTKKKESYSGHLVSFEIQGLLGIRGKLEKLFGMPFGFVKDPLTFIVRFQNTGNFYQKPAGKIEVFDFLGRRVASLELKSQRVLPTATIQFRTAWKPFFLLGPYTASLQFNYGKGNLLLIKDELRFFALSSFTLLILGGLFLVLTFLFLRKILTENRS